MSPPEPAAGGPLNGVDYRRRRVGDANYLFALAGRGDAVLLLHGFPQTHFCWRELIPVLAQSHRVVAPDLRGYGGSRAPAGGEHGEGFSKREVAADLVSLMDGLGLDRFAVVGHDRGARVAYRMALDHPDSVARLCVLNVVPTIDQFERMAGGPSLGYWPWFLLAQPAPFPEQLIAAAPEQLLRFIFDSWTADTSAIDEEAFAIYCAAFSPAAAAAIVATTAPASGSTASMTRTIAAPAAASSARRCSSPAPRRRDWLTQPTSGARGRSMFARRRLLVVTSFPRRRPTFSPLSSPTSSRIAADDPCPRCGTTLTSPMSPWS